MKRVHIDILPDVPPEEVEKPIISYEKTSISEIDKRELNKNIPTKKDEISSEVIHTIKTINKIVFNKQIKLPIIENSHIKNIDLKEYSHLFIPKEKIIKNYVTF